MKKAIKKFLPTNVLHKNVAYLVGGTFGAQLVLILFSPILTRLYNSSEFGVLAIYSSLLSIFGSISTLRYNFAIPIAKKNEIDNVLILNFAVLIFLVFLLLVFISYNAQYVSEILNIDDNKYVVWLLIPGVALLGIYQTLNYYFIREKLFLDIAKTKLTQSIWMSLVQFALFFLGGVALILGRIVGVSAGINIFLDKYKRIRKKILLDVSLKGVIDAAKRYRKFPIYSTWSGLFNTAGKEAPTLLLAVLFSASSAGFYLLAQRVIAMPMTLIGRSISDVFFSYASRNKNSIETKDIFINIHTTLSKVSMPIALFLLLGAPELFVFVFGNEWRDSGVFAQILAPFLYFRFVISPLSQMTSVLEIQGQELVFQIMLFLVRVLSILIGYIQGSVYFAVLYFSLSSAFMWASYSIFLYYISGCSVKGPFKDFFYSLILSVPLVLPMLIQYCFDLHKYYLLMCYVLTILFIVIRYFYIYKDLVRGKEPLINYQNLR